MIWVEWLLDSSFCQCCTLWIVFSCYQKEKIHSLLSSPSGANLSKQPAGQKTPSQGSALVGVPPPNFSGGDLPTTTSSSFVALSPSSKPPKRGGCSQGTDIRQVPAADEIRKECNRDRVWIGERHGESKTTSSGDHPTSLHTPCSKLPPLCRRAGLHIYWVNSWWKDRGGASHCQ